jgi:hypothetical protein
MATNIKKFLENYKLIMDDRSEYVQFEYWGIRKTLEICKCIVPFTYDDLLIEKDNIYLLKKKEFGYNLYELTGLWRHRGHQGHILTVKAVNDGIKGWNISSHCKDYFKIIGDSLLYSFLYSEDE